MYKVIRSFSFDLISIVNFSSIYLILVTVPSASLQFILYIESLGIIILNIVIIDTKIPSK